jgi:hypothetical protein
LSIDPSSTRTGWAQFVDGVLQQAGYFKTKKSQPALVRIADQAADLVFMVQEFQPDVVVLEETSGKVARHKRASHGAGLSVYGMAVGALWYATWTAVQNCGVVVSGQPPRRVRTVLENVWTRRIPKRVRQRRIAMRYPSYAAQVAKDSGGDVADAIGIGEYWLAKCNRPDAESAKDAKEGCR